MGFWRTLLGTIAKNPISFFAVLCVACTAGFLAFTSDRALTVVESPAWCGRAARADEPCTPLLMVQLEAVATVLRDSVRIFGLALIVLVVVVVAGARANFKAGKDGFEGSVGKDDAVAGAEHVKQAADDAAEEVKAAP